LSFLYVLLFEIVSMGAAGGDPRARPFLNSKFEIVSMGAARGDPRARPFLNSKYGYR
jgi:hypothetical protein